MPRSRRSPSKQTNSREREGEDTREGDARVVLQVTRNSSTFGFDSRTWFTPRSAYHLALGLLLFVLCSFCSFRDDITLYMVEFGICRWCSVTEHASLCAHVMNTWSLVVAAMPYTREGLDDNVLWRSKLPIEDDR